jgi:hypothetical protein
LGLIAAHDLDRAELADDVGALERVVEVLAAPEDPRHARALEELVAHDLVPEVVDLLVLGEEAVAAEIEAVAVGVDDRLGDAADLVVGLQHDHVLAGLGQQVARGQPGGPGADDDVGRRLRSARALGGGRVAIGGSEGGELSGGGHDGQHCPLSRANSPAANGS